LQEAVHYLTAKQARVIGLHDRGSLEIGKRADINIIDINRLGEQQPIRVHDFPGGSPRFIQRANGYLTTLVNGKIILEDDELSGVSSGRILRNSH
jgi:N-acyl-D-aspartate/D-glutamate deacylase